MKEKNYKEKEEETDFRTDQIFCRKLKTLNFENENQHHFKFSDKEM
jgi:hypothetical protein